MTPPIHVGLAQHPTEGGRGRGLGLSQIHIGNVFHFLQM